MSYIETGIDVKGEECMVSDNYIEMTISFSTFEGNKFLILFPRR